VSHETAGRLAAPIWADFMRRALKGETPTSTSIPEGVLPVRVNYKTGELTAPDDPEGILEYLLRGEPAAAETAGAPAASPASPPSQAASGLLQPVAPLPIGAGDR
jgi:penicillin-binding protein 1A